MNTTQLVFVSGLALAISAGPALAQTRSNNDQDRPDRTQQDRQDRLEEAAAAVRDRDGRYGSATNILSSLEGLWNVQVRVNRTNWDAMNAGATDRRLPEGREGANPDSTTPRDGDARREQDRRETDRRERDGAERDGQRQDRTGTARNGSMQTQATSSADGLARSHRVMDGNILRTTLLFGEGVAETRGGFAVREDESGNEREDQREMDRRAERREATTTTRTTRQDDFDSNALRSVSFLGYDDRTGEYSLVLMTGQSGAIHYFTGKYDQGARRIVFTGTDHTSPSATRPGQDRTSRNGDGTTTVTKVGAVEGMSIVLQMESNEQYSITAYRGPTSVGSAASTDLGGQPSQRGDRQNDDRSDRRDGDQRQDREGRDAQIAPNVIYKATYTRADASMRSQQDRLFDEYERSERSTIRGR